MILKRAKVLIFAYLAIGQDGFEAGMRIILLPLDFSASIYDMFHVSINLRHVYTEKPGLSKSIYLE